MKMSHVDKFIKTCLRGLYYVQNNTKENITKNGKELTKM